MGPLDESGAWMSLLRTANALTPGHLIIDAGRMASRSRRFYITSTVTFSFDSATIKDFFSFNMEQKSLDGKRRTLEKMRLDDFVMSGCFDSQSEILVGLSRASRLGSRAYLGVLEVWSRKDRCRPELQNDATLWNQENSMVVYSRVGRRWPAVPMYPL